MKGCCTGLCSSLFCRRTIGNALRFALGIFSGKIFFIEQSRKVCGLSGIVFSQEGPQRQASSPSQALPRQLSQGESQAVTFVAKVLGTTRKFLAVLLPLPLRKDFPRSGGRCRAATKGGMCHRKVTERAHAVSPFAKVSDAIRNFPTTDKGVPLGELAANAVSRLRGYKKRGLHLAVQTS